MTWNQNHQKRNDDMSNQWNMNVPGIIDGYNGSDLEVVVPSVVDGVTVKSITGGVFNAKPITTLTIPDGIDISSANGLCLGCSELMKVVIGNGVTAIPSNGFFGCGSLNLFSCSSAYSAIGNGAFYSCTSLQTFEVPASVVLIGESCFVGESSMSSIDFKGDAPSCGAAFNATPATGYYPKGNTTYGNPWNGLPMIERS